MIENQNLTEYAEYSCWWNRPLWGDKTMLERFFDIKIKENCQIPPQVISQYNRISEEVKLLAPIIKALESEKFKEEEFTFFLKFSNDMVKGRNKLKNLYDYVKVLQLAIEEKNSFFKIEDIELFYQSSKHQKFYKFIFRKLEENLSPEEFIKALKNRLNQVLPSFKHKEDNKILIVYVNTLQKLVHKNEVALKVLYFFKKHQLKDYSLFISISSLIYLLQKKNLQNCNDAVTLIQDNEKIFRDLASILHIPYSQDNQETLATILQYLALLSKYQLIYLQFQRLMEILSQWHNFYDILINIRQKYPANQFIQPKEFHQNIPGEYLYREYKNYFLSNFRSYF